MHVLKCGGSVERPKTTIGLSLHGEWVLPLHLERAREGKAQYFLFLQMEMVQIWCLVMTSENLIARHKTK